MYYTQACMCGSLFATGVEHQLFLRLSVFWCGREPCRHALSSSHRGISHQHIERQPDSHRGTTALVNVTQGFVDRVWERREVHREQIQLSHCWFLCRAAERGLTSSTQTPKSGALSAAQTTATPACKWSTPPMFTWSRSLMIRWEHTNTQEKHWWNETC